MEQNFNKEIDFKEKLLTFFKEKKTKILISFFLIFLIIFLLVLKNIYDEKTNEKIADKYIQAGLYLASNKNSESIKIFEDIILSKNKFYAALALNTILEKNLQTDTNKILNYFNTLENLNYSNDKLDIILFKKALYLSKIGNAEESKQILKNLISNESRLSSIAEEILSN